ncbi:MAG: aldo/keto reductase [Clostridiales Family XIII bacterium]|jgi:diketogulonate reductase-like aldo/keto reductase|nr:aldo/keto reductase [Clostridiales Family XIII bacterium]
MKNNAIPTVSLNNGGQIPALGYGVAGLNKGDILNRAIEITLEEGYRMFDNAPFYGNEAEVGAALRSSGVKREELFISTKLPNDCHAYDDALRAFHKSRTAMGLDYLDMYLIHHPMPLRGKFCEAWKALEKLYEEGLVRTIGISNFKERHIEQILATCKVKPMVNELECNPYFTIAPLRKYCDEHEIRVVTWFPLGGPVVPPPPIPPRPPGFKILTEDGTLKDIGAKYGKTPAQVALRWAVDSGMIPIPKSGKPGRIKENALIFDFCLTAEELGRIEALDQDRRLGPDPDIYDDDAAVAMDV